MRLVKWLAMGAAFAAVLGAPGSALGQVRLEVTPVLGPTFFLTDPPETFALAHDNADVVVQRGSYEDAFAAGAFAGVLLGDRWGIEGMFSWVPTRLSGLLSLNGQRAKVNAYMYGLDLAYHIPTGTVLEPYVSAGMGAETYDYRVPGIDTHSDLMWNVAVGTGYRLNDRVGLRLDVRDCLSNFSSRYQGVDRRMENDLMVQAGLRLRFPIGSR